MSREVPFDENLICDICKKKGAFDFMGDYICQDCIEELDVEEHTDLMDTMNKIDD